MKLPVFIVTVILLFIVEDGDALQQFDETEIYNCYYIILCDLRKPYEFRRLIFKSGPELIKRAFVWFKEISLIPIECEDTPQFWEVYPDYKCNHTEEVKRDMFNKWITNIGEYWAEVCNKNPTGEECTKAEDAALELNTVIAEYTAKGVCGSGITSKGQEVAGDIASKAPKDFKPPSFG